MKSGRYEILPRLRYIPSAKVWMCVWRDPGNLIQRRGQPLRYVRKYEGFGVTSDEAMADCQHGYIKASNELDQIKDDLEKLLFPKIPTHCIATSNLPWWKRLFRV